MKASELAPEFWASISELQQAAKLAEQYMQAVRAGDTSDDYRNTVGNFIYDYVCARLSEQFTVQGTQKFADRSRFLDGTDFIIVPDREGIARIRKIKEQAFRDFRQYR